MAREESVTTKELGIAVVGSGRIGTLRARLAAKHPAVRFVAVSDKDPANAKKLADLAGAHVHSADNDEIIAHPEVNAVFVSTPEGEHAAAVCKALELGKAVLVEKPLALSLNDAEAIINTLKRTNGTLRVGYSRRFKECFLRAKEQMVHGRLGRISGGLARVYNSRAQTFAILKRDPHATPVLDVLTYYVDLMCWFLDGNKPVEVVARGQHGIFRDAGYSAHDVTWAIVTFADGAVVNFGISYALPANYPTQGQSDRVELLGTDGTMIIDDDHMEHLIFSEKVSRTFTCPAIRSIWHSSAATPRAIGPWAISGDLSVMKRAHGWISCRPGGRGRARYAGAGDVESENHLRHRARRRVYRAGGADGLRYKLIHCNSYTTAGRYRLVKPRDVPF